MKIPDNLFYTKDHEWINIQDGIAIIGITDYAQGELGDVIFIEFPDIETAYKAGDSIGVIEAVKTVADIYTPINGIVAEINRKLEDEPGLVNKDPYARGWILKLNNIDDSSLDCLSSSEYKNIIQ